jgi:large subunit ribosomal protein L13
MKSYLAKPGEIERKWWIVDAQGKVVGRIATEIAKVLTGKNKPQLTPGVDTGDFVVVINAEKVVLTGEKWDKKIYYRASGWHSGLKATNAKKMRETKPEEILKLAVMGMLPKNKSRQRILKKLKIYPGPEHPHTAQKPEPLKFQGGLK